MNVKLELGQFNWGYFRLDGGAMFGIVPMPLWRRLIPPDDDGAIPMALRSLWIRTSGRRFLVDCGMWNHFPEKLHTGVYALSQPPLAETLATATGWHLDEVTDIIATHLHFDHAGGFAREVDGRLEAAFPRARLHVQKAQLEWAVEGPLKDRGSYVPRFIEFIRHYPGLVVHDGPWTAEEGIRVEVARGHTPGMQVLRVRHGEQTVIHTADMVPTSAHVSLPYIMAYDTQPLETGAEKEALYQRYPEAVYFFEHDPDRPFWTISRREGGGWTRKEEVFI